MNKYFFDSYAIIEVIKGNPHYARFADESFLTTVVNLSEVYYHLLKEMDESAAKDLLKKLNMEYFEITPELALEAAIFRYKHRKTKFSYVDCLGYIVALHYNLLFLTGDNGFEHMPHVEWVK